MRVIPSQSVEDAVAGLCVTANRHLPPDVRRAFLHRQAAESPLGRGALRQLLDNAELAGQLGLPLCQDCGLAVFFVEHGEDVRVEGLPVREAVNRGMVRGYREGYLRKSTCDPFTRDNPGDNSPAVVHFDMVPGDTLRISMMVQGASAEYSRAAMLDPALGAEGVREFVIRGVAEACRGVCAPMVAGLGVGGSFEWASLAAARALLRPLDRENPDPFLAGLEESLTQAVNRLGVGPLGLGGATTCLGVSALAAPCHPGTLPVALAIQCHSARRGQVTL
ncbi:fumarate hydratase [Fundidesulfovibrio soli]|uniref:fumarate hydratase n=1 Tax=Fundidesulfovibrio soli TaxID=2922716 RepID=UPI001FAF6897|nr:fumarate hydratase [Fundidesulfovibrio soli]